MTAGSDPRPDRRQFLASTAAVCAAASGCVPGGGGAGAAAAPAHVVLLGDSIFDNAAYVGDGPPVVAQLAVALGARGRATLRARDGDRVRDVAAQLAGIPADATHLVVSVGGNDALKNTYLLDMEVARSSELLAELATIQADFRSAYAAMLLAVQRRGLPVAVCTIYDSNFPSPQKALADVALSIWNDAILRCAADAGVPVIDLRRIFRAPGDYANEIEPSPQGGAKLAGAIVQVVDGHAFGSRRTAIYG